ncbi:DUF262 domain-containing protein [Paraburkholderia sp. UCT31]|uniref:DUF262 domain-containing protein n=1 Tax=Paraburkholderia sp. UCT31 TaxID=2615209 RepID=UPI0016563BAA|nr:DUF262 domain-containing protein [Paraburkholderia sp. UCT31]MBC8741876.1 DUF262 domain-containing protein [Paraburkholderia sp. UCT31]
MKTALRVPPRVTFGQGGQFALHSLIIGANMAEERSPHRNPNKSLRRVFGFVIPPWQRPDTEWTVEQRVRFIESVYSGIHLGVFCYTDSIIEAPELNGFLIDGQQRLSAIERYLRDEFAVPGEDGVSYKWSELTEDEQARFYRMQFGFTVVTHRKEADLVKLYNLMAFGGTAHRPDQRAELPAGQ